MSSVIRIGIDLGGAKIEGVALTADGRSLARKRGRTPSGDYAGTVAAIAQLVAAIETEAKAEATDGAGTGFDVVFGIILGTWVGGGLIRCGKVLTGINAIAGEWGHNPLLWPTDGERPGPNCYCGKAGCIETFLSGPGLVHDYTGTISAPDTATIVRSAAEGEGPALAALERYFDRLARALATVINIIDPDVIVLGGGLSNIAALYEEVPRRWKAWVFSDDVITSLRAARHGDSSGVRGAAWLWTLPGD